MGVEEPLRYDQRADGPAAPRTPASPLAVKRARPHADGEPSLCAIKITREAARAANQREEQREELEGQVAMGFRGDDVDATVLNISSKGAKIRCDIEPTIGEPLELTFAGEERIEGVVRWVRGGCIGVEFGSGGSAAPAPPAAAAVAPPPFRQLKLVEQEVGHEAADDGGTDPERKRGAKRARVLLAARLRTTGGEIDVRLRDLSCKGALLESSCPLAVGDSVVFARNQTVVPARVAWISGNRVGIEFENPIEESEVLIHVNRAPPPNEGRAQEQLKQAQFRRPNFSERLSDYDRKLARVIGATLGVSLIDE